MQASQVHNARELELPILNMALLEQYKVRKNNLLGRLIDAYLEEAPRFHFDIQTAAKTGRMDDLRAGAHALKSSSYNLGAARLSAICQQLETGALSGDAPNVEQALARLGPEFFEVEQALRSELMNFREAFSASPLPASATSNSAAEDWH